MTLRLLLGATIGATVLMLALHATADAGVGVATCNQSQWCTITASGDVTAYSSQLAIGNVTAGTALAVTQEDIGQQQVGGEILSGTLAGNCGWSQYDRDWTRRQLSANASCANPNLNTAVFVAGGGGAVWSGCYPRCFGGVPLHFDRKCGTHGHSWCYRANCEEFGNYYPWSSSSHPADPIRMTARHVLDVRYKARYGDALTRSPFYLVRDINVQHGTGNWVFVSGAACGISTGRPGSYHWLPRPATPKHRKPSGPSAHAAEPPIA
jgi:hypothetical protein